MNKDLLYKYFAGCADDSERSQIRNWVESSEDNTKEYYAERRLFDLTGIFGEDIAGVSASKPKTHYWRRWFVRTAAAAAIVAATLGGEYAVGRYDVPAVPMQTLTVPPGQRLNLMLADGTSVWLNSASKLCYPGVFNGSERRIEIDGEAFIAVAHNSGQPFVVSTKSGDIRVTGTVFNVDAYSSSTDFEVELCEGSVDFISGDCTYSIYAGQTLARSDNGSLVVVAADNSTPDWVDGIVSFNEMTLREILKRFEKYYGVNIIYDETLSDEDRFSGKFYLDDGAEHALNALRHDIDFSFESDRDFHTIVIKQ